MVLPPMVPPSPELIAARVTRYATFQRVCAWCTPPDALDRLQRQYPGGITHTICPACALKMFADESGPTS